MADVTSAKQYEQKIAPGVYMGYVEFTVDESALTAAATTEALDIAFPANAYPLYAGLAIGAYFTGGSVTAVTAQLGDAGDPNGILAALNVFDTTSLATWTGTGGVEVEYGSTGPAADGESAYAPQILFTSTTDNVVNLTAGFLSGRIFYKRYDFDG
jgi:hypothetical protein